MDRAAPRQSPGVIETPPSFRIAQPYGNDKACEATTISEHATVRMRSLKSIDCHLRWRARDAKRCHQLIVVNEHGQTLSRPNAH